MSTTIKVLSLNDSDPKVTESYPEVFRVWYKVWDGCTRSYSYQTIGIHGWETAKAEFMRNYEHFKRQDFIYKANPIYIYLDGPFLLNCVRDAYTFVKFGPWHEDPDNDVIRELIKGLNRKGAEYEIAKRKMAKAKKKKK